MRGEVYDVDLTNVVRHLGRLSDENFYDVLLKYIKNDYYYVIDFVTREDRFDVRKVSMEESDVSRRIRLYDQPSASKIGVSFSLGSFFGRDKMMKIVDSVLELPVEGLGLLKSRLSDESFVYPEDVEQVSEYSEGKIVKFSGYATLAIDGELIVDVDGYDDFVVGRLYEGYRLKSRDEHDRCYVCGEGSCELIHGGVKEPAWKFLSTTRSTNLSSDKKAFMRCESCERELMLGFYELRSLVKYERFGTSVMERLIVPLTEDKRLWKQLKRVRKDHDGDMDYYIAVERLMERYERRGVDEFLYCRVLQNQRSYVVLTTEIVGLDELFDLRRIASYKDLMGELGVSFLGYFPDRLLEDSREYRWKYVDRMKRYWLGNEDVRLFRDMEKFLKIGVGELSRFSYFSRYKEVGGDVLKDEIVGSKEYALGSLMGLASGVQVKDMRRSLKADDVGYGLVASLRRRFIGYPRDPERMFGEIMKVIDYRYRYFTSEEREMVAKWVEVYATGDFVGDEGYYYLALYKS